MVAVVSGIWFWGFCKAEMSKWGCKPLIPDWDGRGTHESIRRTPGCPVVCNAHCEWPLWRYNLFFDYWHCAAGVFCATKKGIGDTSSIFHCDYHPSLQDGPWWDITQICTRVWARTDPCQSTWRGCWQTLCELRHSPEGSSHWIMVAHPPSRFKSILLGLRCMPTNGKVVAKGWNATSATSNAIAIWEMGNRLRRAYWTAREDGLALYYHCNQILDPMGRSTPS